MLALSAPWGPIVRPVVENKLQRETVMSIVNSEGEHVGAVLRGSRYRGREDVAQSIWAEQAF